MRKTMLARIEQDRIIAGADDDRHGGRCPILAADPTATPSQPAALAFAQAWDRYTGASRRGRPANARELSALKSMLELSLELSTGATNDLASAISEHRALQLRGEALAEQQQRQTIYDVELLAPADVQSEPEPEFEPEPERAPVDEPAPREGAPTCLPARRPPSRTRPWCAPGTPSRIAAPRSKRSRTSSSAY
jgi:hypothetical protein